MDCAAAAGSSAYVWSRASVVSPPSVSNSKSLFPFFLSKLTTTVTTAANSRPIFCSSTGSYSHRWYNPLRTRKTPELASPELTRNWVDADENPVASQERFTIVSYNILGERNAWKHRDMYPNVPYDYLKWNYRKKVICEELIGLNPDVICLQEVDRYLALLDVLKKTGYVGSYKSGDKVDGCAMFWKADMKKQHIIKQPRLGIYTPGLEWCFKVDLFVSTPQNNGHSLLSTRATRPQLRFIS